VIQCKYCPRSTFSTYDAARMLGWRMFRGVSQTGKPLDDVICPSCAGTRPPAPAETWAVRCTTCDWSTEDDPDDYEPVGTAADAVATGRGHECEPLIELKAPKDTHWVDVAAFNRDGTPRFHKPAASPSNSSPVGADGTVGS